MLRNVLLLASVIFQIQHARCNGDAVFQNTKPLNTYVRVKTQNVSKIIMHIQPFGSKRLDKGQHIFDISDFYPRVNSHIDKRETKGNLDLDSNGIEDNAELIRDMKNGNYATKGNPLFKKIPIIDQKNEKSYFNASNKSKIDIESKTYEESTKTSNIEPDFSNLPSKLTNTTEALSKTKKTFNELLENIALILNTTRETKLGKSKHTGRDALFWTPKLIDTAPARILKTHLVKTMSPEKSDLENPVVPGDKIAQKHVTETGLIKVLAILTKTFKKVLKQHEQIKEYHRQIQNMHSEFIKDKIKIKEYTKDLSETHVFLKKQVLKLAEVQKAFVKKQEILADKEKELQAERDELVRMHNDLNLKQQHFAELQRAFAIQNEQINHKQEEITKKQLEITLKQNVINKVLKHANEIYLSKQADASKIKNSLLLERHQEHLTSTPSTTTDSGTTEKDINVINLLELANTRVLDHHDEDILQDLGYHTIDDIVYKYYFNNTLIDTIMRKALIGDDNTMNRRKTTRSVDKIKSLSREFPEDQFLFSMRSNAKRNTQPTKLTDVTHLLPLTNPFEISLNSEHHNYKKRSYDSKEYAQNFSKMETLDDNLYSKVNSTKSKDKRKIQMKETNFSLKIKTKKAIESQFSQKKVEESSNYTAEEESLAKKYCNEINDLTSRETTFDLCLQKARKHLSNIGKAQIKPPKDVTLDMKEKQLSKTTNKIPTNSRPKDNLAATTKSELPESVEDSAEIKDTTYSEEIERSYDPVRDTLSPYYWANTAESEDAGAEAQDSNMDSSMM